MEITSQPKVLTVSDLEFYRKNGYLLTEKPLFNNEKSFSELSEIFETLLKNKGEKKADELDTPHFSNLKLLDYLLAPEVLDVVEDLIGPNIGLFSSHFICKEPNVGRRTPWHEDSSYWDGKFEKIDNIVTVWLALDPTSTENGCMGVVPGTHLMKAAEYEEVQDTANSTFDTEIKKGTFDLEDVVWFELQKGHFSLHDARIIHGANANTSQMRRAGYTMRYFSLDMKFNPEKALGHKLYHARGENIAGNDLIYYN